MFLGYFDLAGGREVGQRMTGQVQLGSFGAGLGFFLNKKMVQSHLALQTILV